ncbi:MAG: NUDIX hydrolase [Crenarchaeota archaeon]|nr:NUDIX hydrolase [Thermoproteota archaeon]MCR8455424.1 NUDIX hydrolase [Thermoproteota archaeon]MCR8487382.1 NUDIX hydrolase [Thermoproteota archaeon]MCR8501087.1 NUDIX hydrolase [Thermoproteota archaeon]
MDEEDRVYPKMPIVAVGALIYDEASNKILLIRRANPPGEGKFSIPGGVVELGEDLVNAVKREVKEETNIDCEILGVIGISNIVVKDDSGRIKWHYIIIDFLIRPKGLETKPATDALEAIWVSVDEALNLNLTLATRKLLEKFKQFISAKNIPMMSVENFVY